MGKLLLFLSFIGLAFLIFGSVAFPTSAAMWLAASTGGYNILRAGLMLLLFTFMITNPPRNMVLRFIVGFLSVGLTVWSITAVYQNTMQLLDGASILAASLSMGTAALEFNYSEEEDAETAAPAGAKYPASTHRVAHSN